MSDYEHRSQRARPRYDDDAPDSRTSKGRRPGYDDPPSDTDMKPRPSKAKARTQSADGGRGDPRDIEPTTRKPARDRRDDFGDDEEDVPRRSKRADPEAVPRRRRPDDLDDEEPIGWRSDKRPDRSYEAPSRNGDSKRGPKIDVMDDEPPRRRPKDRDLDDYEPVPRRRPRDRDLDEPDLLRRRNTEKVRRDRDGDDRRRPRDDDLAAAPRRRRDEEDEASRPRRRRDDDDDRGYKSDAAGRRPPRDDRGYRSDGRSRRDDDRGGRSDRDRRDRDRDRDRYDSDRDRRRDRDRDRGYDSDRGHSKKKSGFSFDPNKIGKYTETAQKQYKNYKPMIDQLARMYMDSRK